MAELKLGYARVSTVDQDLTAQREALTALGVDPKGIYVDHGLTGTNRDRSGLRQALAACRSGDALVVVDSGVGLGADDKLGPRASPIRVAALCAQVCSPLSVWIQQSAIYSA